MAQQAVDLLSIDSIPGAISSSEGGMIQNIDLKM